MKRILILLAACISIYASLAFLGSEREARADIIGTVGSGATGATGAANVNPATAGQFVKITGTSPVTLSSTAYLSEGSGVETIASGAKLDFAGTGTNITQGGNEVLGSGTNSLSLGNSVQWTTLNITLGNAIQSFFNSSGGMGVGTSSLSAGNQFQVGGGTFAVKTNGGIHFAPMTKAKIQAMTPAVGDAVMCSDCTNSYTICAATGAVIDGWREVGTANGCQ